MADQLSLELAVGLPRLPASLRPMIAQLASEPFDSPDHLFEPSWGGTRILAFIEPSVAADEPVSLRLLDERGRDLSQFLPELASLPDRVAAASAVLDGEVVVVDRLGRGDPLALAARLRGSPGPSVAFLAFDLLYIDGRPLLATPLERRRQRLRRVLSPGDEAIPVPSIVGDGRALFAAVEEAGIAGVMGRVRRSPYLPGVRSRLWRFVRRGSRADADAEGNAPTADTPPSAGAPHGANVDAAASTERTAPMLALIRRLPLDDAS